jgi:membrane-bound lytic murein transglycosylase D
MFFRKRNFAVQFGCAATFLGILSSSLLAQNYSAGLRVRPLGVSPEPPQISGNAYLRGDMPKFMVGEARLGAKLSGADLLAARAEEAFQTGKRLQYLGNVTEARFQFDRSVDLYMQALARAKNNLALYAKFEEAVDAIYRLDVTSLDAGLPLDEPGFDKSPLEDILELTFPVDPKLKSKVKAELQATVSQLPLTMNDSVLGFIHYFSGRGRRTMINGLQRAGRYRPMIQRILAEEGIPQELIHLAQAESGFYPRAVSRMKASGMWQFMAFRGREYGLEQTQWKDDRFDPEKATRAAARHLRDLYEQFGDWYLAIAAYNCGPGAVERAVERSGYADFWELRARRLLPLETSNYVPIILAMTIMTKNAKEYGLEGLAPEAPVDYDVVEVDSPTHLALVSDLAESTVAEIQALNPALLRNIAPAGYALRVPKNRGDLVATMLRTIPAERRASWRVHRVGAGDTLATIGRQYGEAPASILQVNDLEAAEPTVGDLLFIPKAIPAPPAAANSGARRQTGSHKSRPAVSRSKSPQRPARRAPGVQTASRRLPQT